ncbi:MAG: C2H2 finger domain-containing [Lasallia pustulata]|uniref:C2H2 finger domain-containing n=1 Tax=Lasallia pustulata TaxID=136370 RepID=A0A1W5D281_9LECA|nr:MAG: C2H2 finger domain-containing [Lasallia pustulata]SLM37130.1 c2h2 finger domain-containing protein [Lasallia pustulata]
MGSIRRSKTKRRTRDLDQVHADLRSPKHLAQHKTTKPAEDLPGLGKWYCVECAKWFEGEHSLVQHRKGKNHKRRIRALRTEPYTQKEAEAAVGLGTDNGKRENVERDSMEDISTADNAMAVEGVHTVI